MDSLADNFNPLASISGFCSFMGCTDQTALNYNSEANVDDGSAII
ncbi:MAG: hypothetical protein CM15mP23_18410 [Cryomorphaceae bacterium]|nr:MAG: hypothetical protein CM15mP23_18410 [Cryomorphaceae bacterium]